MIYSKNEIINAIVDLLKNEKLSGSDGQISREEIIYYFSDCKLKDINLFSEKHQIKLIEKIIENLKTSRS